MSVFHFTLSEILRTHARLMPQRTGARDLHRSLTWAGWSARSDRLANALLGLGLSKGDRVGVLAWNCVEWAELYMATARAGIIIVPVNFRNTAEEILYVMEDAGVSAMVVQDGLCSLIEELEGRHSLGKSRLIRFGAGQAPGWSDYEALLATGQDSCPPVTVLPSDPWTLMYTSGTTGRPKGVLRSHQSMVMLSLVTEVEVGIGRNDDALLVMPMCHANSLNFFCSYVYAGACVTIYSRRSFDPDHALATMAGIGSTFTSLVPTHYIMMLGASGQGGPRPDLGRMQKLMISSAPARADTKREVMEMFPNSGLFELYGSSEAGWVTMLHPDEQFTHLGTVGRECVGSGAIALIGEDGQEVRDGEPGELYSLAPYHFDRYWNQPDKTAEAFRGQHLSVGDMAIRDEAGFIRLIDRKKNMIISGGENIYPSEVEAVLGGCPAVQDVAVIGLPDAKWGETVHAVIVVKAGAELSTEAVLSWCDGRIASYKKPRSVTFLTEEDMPRTATGKVLHRVLRDRLSPVRA